MLNAMVQQLYEQIRRRRTRVRFVHVSVSNMEPENWQPEFFAADTKQKNLTESIDQIRKRFGFTALMSAESQILKTKYRMDKHGYILHTPSLSQ